MKIAIVRGSYLNKYEMQNYEPLARKFDITGFSGLKPIHHNFKFPIKKLFSPVDLPNFPYKMPILNRLCFSDAMYLFNLEKELKGFDIVHTRETYFHFTRQALNAKRKGYVKKVICTCSETIPFNNEGIWNRRNFKQRAIKEVDVFHCLTNRAKKCLVKEGCNLKKIIVFPYGVNLKKFKAVNQLSRLGGQTTIKILFVGRLVKEKGIYDLLKAFVQLIKQKHKIHLTIIGKGREKANIINLINNIGIDEFIEIKQVSYNKMPLEYQKADIFVLLSKPTKHWEEYFGMSIVEAMASGLPIISTKCGAIPEVINGCGLLVPPGDWKATYKVLLKLIRNKDLRKKYSFQTRKRAEKYFDSQETAKNIDNLWRKP